MAGGLNVKQRRFVEEYVKVWNATEAARLAGYKGNGDTLATVGWKLLRVAEIDAEIKRVLQASAMSADEVLMRLGATARSDMGPFIDEYGHVSISKIKEAGMTHLIRKVKWRKMANGEWVCDVELHDPLRAQEILAKAHGLLKDKLEVSGPQGEAIPIEIDYRSAIAETQTGSTDDSLTPGEG